MLVSILANLDVGAPNVPHICHICPDPTIVKGCPEFKRHIQEHYVRWYCVLLETVINTEEGTRCATCPTSNPDPSHLNAHSSACSGTNYSRKDTLISHQSQHKKDHGPVLATEHSSHVEKRYFACGFCISCSESPKELANHIHDHFHAPQHIPDWEYSKVILGLLSARGERHPILGSSYRWDPALRSVKDLQDRLELGQERPDILVADAIARSYYPRSEQAQAEPVLRSSLTGPELYTNPQIQTFPFDYALSPLASISEQYPTPHTPQMTAPTAESQAWYQNYGDQPHGSQTYALPISTMDQLPLHRGDSLEQQQSDLCSGSLEQQQSDYVPSMWSVSLGAHSQRLPVNATIVPRTRQTAAAPNYPAPPSTGWPQPVLAPDFTPLPLSHNYPISPFVPPTSAGSFRDVGAQRSRQETLDHRIDDTNDDFDGTERFMQNPYWVGRQR